MNGGVRYLRVPGVPSPGTLPGIHDQSVPVCVGRIFDRECS